MKLGSVKIRTLRKLRVSSSTAARRLDRTALQRLDSISHSLSFIACTGLRVVSSCLCVVLSGIFIGHCAFSSCLCVELSLHLCFAFAFRICGFLNYLMICICVPFFVMSGSKAIGSMVWAGGLNAFVDLIQKATPATAFVVVCLLFLL